jgi:hypothetical protein
MAHERFHAFLSSNSMPQVTYLIGQTVEARKRLLEEEISLRGISPMNSLHIVASRTMVMELEGRGPGTLHRLIDTLTSIIGRIFYDEIYYQCYKEFSFMDDAMRELAVQVILERRNNTPEGLRYFFPLFTAPERDETLPGVYRHILGFFSLLVNNNFEDRFADELSRKMTRMDEESPGTGEERYALDADLALLFGDYEEFKTSNLLYDNDDIVSSVRAFLAAGKCPVLLRDIHVIIFDGFTSITKAEKEILLNLFKNTDEVIWPLDFDPKVDDPINALKDISGLGGETGPSEYEAMRIFSSLASLIEDMERAGFSATIKKATEGHFGNPYAEGLYRGGRYDGTKGKAIKLRSFNTRPDEVRGIASEIKKISKLKKMRDLGGARVIFPDVAEYSSLIYEIFPEFGIPFNITKGLPLTSSPITRLFRLLIDIPLNGYTRDDIFKFFASSLVSPPTKRMDRNDRARWLAFLEDENAFFADETRADVERSLKAQPQGGNRLWIESLYKVARQCGIQGGDIATDWLSRARDYFFCLYRNRSQGKGGGEILSEYHRFLNHLFFLKENVRPLANLPHGKNLATIVQDILNLLDIFEIQKNVLSPLINGRGLCHEAVERIIRRDMSALNMLQDLVIRAAKELDRAERYAPPRKIPLLERFTSRFIDLINHARIREYYSRGAVDISEWEDITGCSFDVIFAGGLSAEEFPLREPDGFLIPESPGPYLRKKDLTDQSRYLFSYILCNYRQDLYLSYPRRIREKEVQPSPFLLDMASMIDDRVHSPFQGIEVLEGEFPWEQNPWFTSKGEFVNSIEVEKRIAIPLEGIPFPLTHIILGTDTSLNESIIRGVQALMARDSADALSEYDGLVSTSQGFPLYLSRFEGPFSTSRLDMMANCPLRYLFQGIFGLEPVEELEEELSIRDVGSHVHAILRMIFGEIRKYGENVASVGLPRAFALAREIGTTYFSRLKHLEGLDFFETQKRDIMDGLGADSTLTVNGLPTREGLLAQVLRFEEQDLRKEDVIAVEHWFGGGGVNPVMMGGITIRGYIDRIDRSTGEKDVFLIYDYKTGRAPALSQIKKGLSFQLPGYVSALAVEREVQGVVARYYLINRRHLAERDPFTSPISDNLPQRTGIDLSGVTLIGDYVNRLMHLLKKGIFHHSTDELHCSFCEFKYACYKHTRRMAHLVDSGDVPDLYSGRKNLEKWKEVEGFQKRWKEVQRKMAEPLEAKNEEKRKENLEQVLEFKRWLMDKRHSLPFDEDYIDKIVEAIENYRNTFSLQFGLNI